MLSKRIATALGTAVLLVWGTPARADVASDLLAKMTAAMAQVTSFEVQTALPMGAGVTTVDRKAKAVKSTMTVGPSTIDSVVANSVLYLRINGGEWQTRALPAEQSEAMVKAITSGSALAVLPDKTDGGTTVGMVKMTTKLPANLGAAAAGDVTMTCSYDKTTLFLRTCTMPFPQNPAAGDITMTYAKYNDPKNVVAVPAGVATPAPLAAPAAK